MYCKKCGSQLQADDLFCSNCGASVAGMFGSEDQDKSPSPGYQNIDVSDLKGDKGRTLDPWTAGMPDGVAAPPTRGGEDPWAGGQGGQSAAARPARKKHTLRNVLLIALGVVVLALTGLYALGSAKADYEPVIESYLAYAEADSAQRVESLFYPAVLEQSVDTYGRAAAIEYMDANTKYYGREVESCEVAWAVDGNVELVEFNDDYGASAGTYTEAAVNVCYCDGTYTCLYFDLVQVEESWYLVRVW